ncbi:hypothetical protein AURDEDRAFT_170683 [Auricularia subglabra TFB-10046 SS5]|nr:hypothetical protein AURDEDRAFT_170683 [Auricularia subglabra TFB-10046 SS5]
MVGLLVPAAAFALLLAGRAAAQSLPDCTRRCITVSATPGCDINHLDCICASQSMLRAIPACINDICGNGGGSGPAIDAFNARCAALAGNAPTSTPPPPKSPTPSPSSPQDPPSGLLGGLLVVGIIGCFLWRRRRREDDQLHAYGVAAMSSTSSGLSGQLVRPSSVHKHSDSLQSGAQLTPYYQDAPGPASVSETLAARPLVLDTQRSSYPRRKGDPPAPPSFRGPVSPETELASSVTSQSHSYRDEMSPQGSAPPMVFPAGLTPAQLDLVQTMINRGLQGTAVVDVIERMLAENSTPAPQYDDDTSSPART